MAAISTDILIKLATAGPKLSCAEEVEPFVTYYDGAYNWQLTVEQAAIAMSILRSKISGEPLQSLISHPELTRWTEIKALLRKSFMDHRSVECLIDALVTAQLRGSVVEFHKYLSQLRAKAVLRYKIDNPTATRAEINNNASMIGRIAVKQFKNKLYEPLRSILEMRCPETLEDAMDILRNTNYDLRRIPNDRQVQRNNNYHYYRNSRGERPPPRHHDQGNNSLGSVRSASNVNRWQNDQPNHRQSESTPMDLGSTNTRANFR